MKVFHNIIGQEVKIFGDILEDEALAQIQRLADFKPYQNSHIRIMPDVHAGKGCTIGTTLVLDDAVTPNLVGVDIGCGMFVVPLGNAEIDLPLLDQFSDQELREELKNRVDLRKAAHIFLRCRDCKHCGEGCCHKSSRYKTSVCFLKPKPQVGPDRYYATLLSRKACVNFEPK